MTQQDLTLLLLPVSLAWGVFLGIKWAGRAKKPGAITHNVVITARGKDLAGSLKIHNDHVGRVIGRDQAIKPAVVHRHSDGTITGRYA